MPVVSKKTKIKEARSEYSKLDRAYHAVGKKTLGAPARSVIRKDYQIIKRARNLAGKRLGKLTGIRK